MDSSSAEIVKDLSPFFRLYKDGRVERYSETDFVPPSEDPVTGVLSKDVIFSSENNLSARLYLPRTATTEAGKKLPLLIYVHGGAFSIQSAFSSLYHPYLNHLVSAANAIAVSVEYRLAPEHPLPACYDDSWSLFNWVVSHLNGKGPEPWLRDHVDFQRIFLAGDSAGANIAHDMLVRATANHLKVAGMALIHPFFGNDKPDEIWLCICPDTTGLDDPRLNPAAHPNLLAKLGCSKILICTAEKDHLRQRGWTYYEALKNSGWPGEVEMVETKGEQHVFHLFYPSCENADIFLKQVASFIK